MNLPEAYRVLLKPKAIKSRTNQILHNHMVHTVCEEALCPNRGECFASGTATFLIMGDICTRNCTFCAIKKGKPSSLNYSEIDELVDTIIKMQLEYVVITSVTRDDLEDGGLSYYNYMLETLKNKIPGIRIEILIPDFNKNPDSVKKLKKEYIDILNHNLETIQSLYSTVRPMADYNVSLQILRNAKKLGYITKTGIMLGLGEKRKDIVKLFEDIHSIGIDILTIGQYIRPSKKHHRVEKYYLSNEFEELKTIAEDIGIKYIVSDVFVRSSYNAFSIYKELTSGK